MDYYDDDGDGDEMSPEELRARAYRERGSRRRDDKSEALGDENSSFHIARDIAGLLVLIRKWYHERAISRENRVLLKEAVLECNLDLILAFRRFVKYNDKERLVDALLEFIPDDDDKEEEEEEEEDNDDDGSRLAEGELLSTLYLGDQEDADTQRNAKLLLRECVANTPFGAMDLDDLWTVFEDDADYKSIQQANFEARGARLCQLEGYEPRFVARFLLSVFELLDHERAGAVDFGELLAGLALMTRSSKAEKLQFCFDLMDADGDGVLSVDQLFRFLLSASTVITAVLAAAIDDDEDEESSATGTAALREEVMERAKSMFVSSDIDETSPITYEAFAAWQTNPVNAMDGILR